MTKKMKVMCWVMILLAVIAAEVTVAFADIGVGTAFGYTINGLSYIDYTIAFYDTWWKMALAGCVFCATTLYATQGLYKACFGNK